MKKTNYKSKIFFLFIFCFAFFALAGGAEAANWYVDNTATGSNNGTSWSNGWTELNQVVWGIGGVVAGDTLWISGGVSGQTYTTTLQHTGSHATSDNRIYIRPGAAHPTLSSGHDGIVAITVSGGYGMAVYRNYTTIDGSGATGSDRKIKIYRCGKNGVNAQGKGITIKYLEIVDTSAADSGNDGDNNSIRFSSNSGDGTYQRVDISFNKIQNPYRVGIYAGGPNDQNMYGLVLIHDNELTDFGGEDQISVYGNGVDIYNNTIHGRVDIHKVTNHPDGIVLNLGQYARIYNNIVYDFANSITQTGATNAYIYINPYTTTANSTSCCIRVMNNLLFQTSVLRTDDYPRGIEMSWQKGGSGSWLSISDVIVANNTIVGMPYLSLSFVPDVVGASGMSNIYFVNNLIHDCGKLFGLPYSLLLGPSSGAGNYTVGNYDNTPSVVFDYNIMSAGTGVNSIYVKDTTYTYSNFKSTNSGILFQPNKNTDGTEADNPNLNASYKLESKSTVALNKGKDISALTNLPTTNDISGTSRPQGSAWDIGAYEYIESGGDVTPPAAPSGLQVQ